jgi:hypothetical protein
VTRPSASAMTGRIQARPKGVGCTAAFVIACPGQSVLQRIAWFTVGVAPVSEQARALQQRFALMSKLQAR